MHGKLKGLSLIEVVVSMGIFSLMMLTIAGIFGSSISNYRQNKIIERNLENAQFVMNDLAKQLRTSTVVDATSSFSSGNGSFASPGIQDHVRFYDYSQSRCIEYTAITQDGNHVIRMSSLVVARSGCNPTTTLTDAATVTIGDVSPTFHIVTTRVDPTPTDSRMGRVTMVFVVRERSGVSRNITLQTTVSLRDYAEAGIL